MAQRKIDVVLASVKRLIRVGASANLLNLLQKQHPADLAAVLVEGVAWVTLLNGGSSEGAGKDRTH